MFDESVPLEVHPEPREGRGLKGPQLPEPLKGQAPHGVHSRPSRAYGDLLPQDHHLAAGAQDAHCWGEQEWLLKRRGLRGVLEELRHGLWTAAVSAQTEAAVRTLGQNRVLWGLDLAGAVPPGALGAAAQTEHLAPAL